MNVFANEFKTLIKSIIAWSVSMTALALVFFLVYPAYSQEAVAIRELLEGYPPALLKAFGFDIESIFTPLGFYSLVFKYIILCGSIQAMILGVSLIAKEFNRKTADFLMTKPVSRANILTNKVLASVISLIITDIIVFALSWFAFNYISREPIDFRLFIMISLTLFLIEMIFYVLGLFLAVTIQKIKSVTGFSLGIVFGFFAA
jgi:ABC-2 type transport system permease protein